MSKAEVKMNELEERRKALGWNVKQIALAYAEKLGEPGNLNYLKTVQRIFKDPDSVAGWRRDLVIEILGGSLPIVWTPLSKMPSSPIKKD